MYIPFGIAAKFNCQMFMRICIYKELGWKSLAERGKRRKLQMFYDIQLIMHPGIFVT
jgi:hypothetical protein